MADKDICDEDIELFRKSIGSVTRIIDDKVRPERQRPTPRPHIRTRDTDKSGVDMLSDALHELSDEPRENLLFTRPGISARLLKKLRRGQIRIEGELDLHGRTIVESQTALSHFLEEAAVSGIRCVRIVHGKGFGSPHGRPVIKTQLDRWLRLRNDVLAFTSARPADGGTGAMYVLLRS